MFFPETHMLLLFMQLDMSESRAWLPKSLYATISLPLPQHSQDDKMRIMMSCKYITSSQQTQNVRTLEELYAEKNRGNLNQAPNLFNV